MATYTAAGSTLVCTGTDITSAGILSALNSNGLGTGHFGQTSGNKDTYYFNARIQIGDGSSSGSASVWDCSNEVIKINGLFFRLYGTVQMGSYPSNISTGGGSFIVTSTAADFFRLYDNGVFRAYGSFVYASARIRMDNDTEFTIIDCDAELEDGVSVGESGSAFGARQQITYDRTRIHHTQAVGIKLYSFNSGANAASYSLAGTRVEKCTYGFQLGNSNNLSPILKDVQIDTCTNHIVPNSGDANVTFVNPDFTSLRGASIDNNDITTIAFRYNFKVQDSSNVVIQNSKVYIVDQNDDVVVNSELTDAGGLINSHLFDYDGDICLQNSTFAGSTKTNREDHTRSVYKYGFLPKTDTITIDQDTKDFVALLPDANITESNKATVDAYTEIDTSAKFHDRSASYLEDNFGTYLDFIVTRSGNQIDAGNYDITIDATASSVFDLTGNTITIKASAYNGGATTTGKVTTQNGTLLSGGTFDCDVNYQTGAGTTLTNVTVTSGNSIDFNTEGTYTLNGCTIDEVTNSSGGAVTLNLINGASVTTNTGPSITLASPVNITAPNILTNSRVQIYNVTKGAELDNSVVSDSYSLTVNLAGASVDNGDAIRMRVTYQSGVVAMAELEASGVVTASGLSFVNTQTSNAVYDAYGLDGSTVTEFSFDSGNIEIDINDLDNTTEIQRLAAWEVYFETTEEGIRDFFGCISWESLNSVKIDVSMCDLKIDNVKVTPLLLTGGRLFRSDGTTVIASGSNSVQIDYEPVYIGNADDITEMKATIDTNLDVVLSTRATQTSVDDLPASVPSVPDIVAGVFDEVT